ncbi:MBL fold metallo-hydrolase [Erwinia persicina]|uniref:MBL fold metallo-hydrolase n=1 Tax=Erwinia persicina TaxID=55211 RepID=A0A4U3FDG9_9GAMM|nr:MBL fold metallo-hydrolase [Erwinia persicina]MBC3945345.1 MBL fold metallo-hydrolase [Erwinia persicina]MBD8106980.1 MBL fold metallo-hydrolase [Erwinia persicina]MBD8210060.1 MBL fold metallo-hydrolase [Erwinia persicina]MCQ4095476.1 MBL fold metallo-hydrolase [Erwinia persicina]MCQ4099896.1 MBL fold metallo-hydrolase [Erwinia persicina]
MKTRLTLLLALTASAPLYAAETLKLEVYNPGEASMFAVSSEIISGPHEVVLIDAQFQRNDAEALVKRIKATGKRLTTVFISQSDPDFYFGLETIKQAFPQAKIIATAATVDLIKQSKDGKLAFWGPKMGANAPQSLVVPDVLTGNSFRVDGETIEVKGIDGPQPQNTYLWVPALKTVMGGVVVYGNNIHVWMADAQTPAERSAWQQKLEAIQALKPARVVPGHFLPGAAETLASVNFTQQYLKTAETVLAESQDAASYTAAMKTRYPALKEASSLELSAKVLKGEMKWPQ